MGIILGLCSMAKVYHVCVVVPHVCCANAVLVETTHSSWVDLCSFLVVRVCVACVKLISGMEEQLNKIPGFCENEKGVVPCNILVGYILVCMYILGALAWLYSVFSSLC
uniref:Uncharacterized protein n=1 Tax=Sciurus vulgaris TaxID=55149 RepID=A0A8D2JKJ0_SCIVU